MYRWRAGAMLRASTDPGGLDLPRHLDLYGENAAARGRAWLAEVWQRTEVRDALAAASPGLCRQIADVVVGRRDDPRLVRRVVLSLASYLLRWQRRPTPFGLFAGIAAARIGATTQLSWGSEHRTVARPDAEWLTDILDRLHQCPGLLQRLPVVAIDIGQTRGDRYVVPGWPADGHAELMPPVELSVRHTRPVAAALEFARTPIPYDELRTRLTRRFSGASLERIDALLGDLLAQHLLITSLWPPATCLDTLGHLCAQLDAVRAETLPAIADLVSELRTLRDGLAAGGADSTPPSPWATTSALARQMTALSDTASVPLVVETALDCDVRLPAQVVREAEAAVGVLARATPFPYGYPHWRDYHQRFLDRYGTQTTVPVLDLVADSGLGLPAGYLGAAQPRPDPYALTRRDERLLALVQQSTLDGSGEIVLTEPLIADLAGPSDVEAILPPRVEVSVEIHAATPDALDRGAFRLVITGAPRPASSMAGRFAHLLSEEDRDQLAATYQTSDPDVIAAQLSFAPRRRRNENIARTAQLLPHVIPLAEHRAPHAGLIPLSDLAVTADERRFFLVQLSTGRRIEPRVTHALEAGAHTPPLARFLAEITTARCAVYQAFDFGAAHRLPYLPRVRHQRTVLSPARWLLTAEDLPGPTATPAAWNAALEAWRERLRAPARLTLVEHDQRLPLDLTHPLHQAVLRARLKGTRHLALSEAPDPGELAWIGRAHELLLPLSLTEPSHRLPPPRPQRTAAEHLPDHATVVTAHIHAHPERHDEILTSHLPHLINALDPPPPWWFSRQRPPTHPDAAHHLAITLRLPDPGTWGPAVERLHHWADTLRRQRLVAHWTLTTHEPKPHRYGHGPAREAAHDLFAADAAAALAQIRMTMSTDTLPQALAAASMVDLAASFAPTIRDGLAWLVHHIPRAHGPLDRKLRDQALRLADPHGATETLRSLTGGQEVAAAWQQRAAALVAYRKQLADQREPLTLLDEFLHLHHARVLGIDANRERVTQRLVRACALRHTARDPQ